MVNNTQFWIDNGYRSPNFAAFVYNRYFSICLHRNPDNVFIKEMDDFITCTLRCIIENVFGSTYKKKNNGNLILKVAVDVVLRLDLQRKLKFKLPP